MKKLIYSGAFKALLAALLLFSSFAACIYGFLTLRSPLLYRSAESAEKTEQYSSLFLKNVERTAVYVRYLEDGYSMHMMDCPPELELLLEGDSINKDNENYLLNVYEPSETAFYYYFSKLNAEPTNYRYYVKNTVTGVEYFSAGFEEYAAQKSGSVDSFLASGILTEPTYLIMNTKNNRTMTGGGNERILTRANLLWSMDFLRRPLSDMAEENEYGYNYQSSPELPENPNAEGLSPDNSFTENSQTIESEYLMSIAGEGEEEASEPKEETSIRFSEEPEETLAKSFDKDTLPNGEKAVSYLLYAFVDNTLAEDEFSVIIRNFTSAKEDYKYGIKFTLFYSVLTIILFLLCNVVSGRRSTTSAVVLRMQDRLFTEVILAVILAFLALPVVFYDKISPFLREFVTNYPNHAELLPVIFAALTVCLLLIGFAYFSLVRRAKAGTLLTSSFLGRFIFRPLGGIFSRAFKTAKEFFRNLSTLKRTALFLFLSSLWIFASLLVMANDFLPGSLLLLVFFLVAAYLFIRNALDRKRILKNTEEMSSGNLSVRIETDSMISSNKHLSEEINHICDGLHSAVEEQTKSERMKTELITNVSHDIKTPLTSIINFIELLNNELPEEGPLKEYANILSQKSWRLKALIDDLVEASKASSGTMKLDPITFNLSELVRQAIGDFEERLTEKGLTLCLTLPEEPVLVMADGACTHRIIENLLSNVCKYAMKGTRVFVNLDLPKDIGLALFTMKNVSAAALKKSSEELLTRFSRGDEARSDEGSGLGLSIAESLAKLQGGAFYVEIDGDMFKAKVTVPLAKKGESPLSRDGI